MHALTMLHRMLATNCPQIHAKRLTSLVAAVEAAVGGSALTLSGLGRGLRSQVAVKHSINASIACSATAHCIRKRPRCMKPWHDSAWPASRRR